MTAITKEKALEILNDMNDAMKAVCEKHGLVFSTKAGRFTDAYVSGQFQLAVTSSESESRTSYENDWFVKTSKFGRWFGLDTSHINTLKLKHNGEEIVFKGMTSSKFVVVGLKNGKYLKFNSIEFAKMVKDQGVKL